MSIPALGYRNRTEAALALRDQGLGPTAIGAQLGISASAVSGLISSRERNAERAGEIVARRGTDGVDLGVKIRLRPHAARRGMSTENLINLIVKTVAEEDLVDAVLDDREAGAA